MKFATKIQGVALMNRNEGRMESQQREARAYFFVKL